MKSNAVELRGVGKTFGSVAALLDLDLDIEQGSFVTLLGPSGCGKTTTLRLIAGLESATSGDIFIRGRRINDVPIHKRNLGIVFQNFALFPHRTVFENIAFGLKYRRLPKSEIPAKVKAALEKVRLPTFADRMPSQLSGGQQQRVALARAIIIEPEVLLLDEPFSALDANLREEMRVELKVIQRDLGITTLFVTHDQGEALALSDKVVLMNQGRKEQEGPPEDVYNFPRTRFSAEFIGCSNILPATVVEAGSPSCLVRLANGPTVKAQADGIGPQAEVELVLRAERIALHRAPVEEPDAVSLRGRISAVDYQGISARYFVEVDGVRLQAINPIEGHPFREGDDVFLRVRAADCVLLHGRAR